MSKSPSRVLSTTTWEIEISGNRFTADRTADGFRLLLPVGSPGITRYSEKDLQEIVSFLSFVIADARASRHPRPSPPCTLDTLDQP